MGTGIAVDDSGAVYVTGMTDSHDFPTQNPYQAYKEGWVEVFVTKLSSSGNSLVYSTYLGDYWDDWGLDIAVDDSGAAYVTGWTESSLFPTENEYQTNQGGYLDVDVFVTKFNSDGDDLVYSTYLGGSSVEYGEGIAVDGSGSAYVTGRTYSTDFPTENEYQTDQLGHDVFVTKFNSDGDDLVYSTYLGGSSDDYGNGIAVDSSGAAYVVGYTYSTDFPTENEYQTNQDTVDAFVTKLSSSGDSLTYSTYLGGSHYDLGKGIAVDGSGAAYVTGHTYSTDFPIENEYQTDQDYTDAFVTKLSASGNNLVYSTYLGGSSSEEGYDIALDSSGAAYVTGITNSTDFPTENEYQTDQTGTDAFVTKISSQNYLCGDADASSGVDIDDVVYLINYIYSGGPEPAPYWSGDADCSGGVDIDDVVYIYNYIFGGGPDPCDPDDDDEPDC